MDSVRLQFDLTPDGDRPRSYGLQVVLHRVGEKRPGRPPARVARWVAWGGWLSLLVGSNPLVRRSRLRALLRFWAWQIWRRLPNGGVDLCFRDGACLFLPSWSYLAGVVLATGSHEPAEQTFVHRLVRENDRAIDVGANLGLYAARLANAGVVVSAFEPNKRARTVLEDNLSRNASLERWRVYPFALSDYDGSVLMTSDLESSNYILADSSYSGKAQTVPVHRLDTLVAQDESWGVDDHLVFMKIDAEGTDARVLRGAQGLVEARRPIILIETWAGDDEARSFLKTMGYRFYHYSLSHNCLVEFRDDWDGQANLIAIPDSKYSMASQRIQSSSQHLCPPRVRWMRRMAENTGHA